MPSDFLRRCESLARCLCAKHTQLPNPCGEQSSCSSTRPELARRFKYARPNRHAKADRVDTGRGTPSPEPCGPAIARGANAHSCMEDRQRETRVYLPTGMLLVGALPRQQAVGHSWPCPSSGRSGWCWAPQGGGGASSDWNDDASF